MRRNRSDAPGPTHRSTKFGSPMCRRGQALSAHVLPGGSRPRMAATQWARAMLVKGWARRLANSATPPRRFAQRPGIASLLCRPTHSEVTSMSALGPPHRHPMPSGLFKRAAAGQSSTPTLPSSPLFFSTPPLDHGRRHWIEGRVARAPTGPWPWRQASREPWREP
jgi:hypothetical protein